MPQKLTLFLILFIGFLSHSQTQFSGQITDEKNAPLMGCDVHLGRNNFMTDSNGNFSTQVSKLGKQKLFIAYLGYISIDTTLVVTDNMVVNFKMKPKMNELSNIIINQQQSQDKTGSNSRKIKQKPVIS